MQTQYRDRVLLSNISVTSMFELYQNPDVTEIVHKNTRSPKLCVQFLLFDFLWTPVNQDVSNEKFQAGLCQKYCFLQIGMGV